MNSFKIHCMALACLIFLANHTTFGQENQKIYFDSEGDVTSASAESYITYQLNKKDKNQIIITGFYNSGSKKLEGIYFLKKELDLIDFNNFYKSSFWLDAVKDGDYKEWYNGGILKEQGIFIKGKKNGEYRQWYENGNLMAKQNLIDGKEEGEITTYYETGGLKLKYQALDGSLNGELSEWYDNGQKKKAVQMKDGLVVGEEEVWDQNGNEVNAE